MLSQLEGLRSKLVKEQTLHQQNSELRAEIDSLRILTSAPQAEKKKKKKNITQHNNILQKEVNKPKTKMRGSARAMRECMQTMTCSKNRTQQFHRLSKHRVGNLRLRKHLL